MRKSRGDSGTLGVINTKKDDCCNKTTKNDQNPVGQDLTQKGILHKIVHINKIRLRTVKQYLVKYRW